MDKIWPMAKHSRAPAISCAENIALSFLLHPVPTRPFPNPRCYKSYQRGYILPLDKELNLADTVSFLAKTKDGPDHIPAVCVEEGQNSTSLNILVAVNKYRSDDARELTHDLKQGFERIFVILATVTSRENSAPSIENDIFSAIISMCSGRILCRLRLNSTAKKPITRILQEAVQVVERISHTKIEKRDLKQTRDSFIVKARGAIKQADLWLRHQTLDGLRDLVQGIYHISQVAGLEVLMGLIVNRDMDPDSRAYLLNVTGKVGRYREAARFLYRLAKKFPLARQMRLILADLPREAFDPVSTSGYCASLVPTLSQISPKHAQQENFRVITQRLGTSEELAKAKFSAQVEKSLTGSKIHAEIQLIAYCELHASELPPRIICSSKDACFLCNSFICLYGKMHTPRCHGRLYPNWRLPHLLEFKLLEQKFNRLLENHITQCLRTLLSTDRRAIYPYPNESTLLPLPASVTTVLTSDGSVCTLSDINPVQSRSSSPSSASRTRTYLSSKVSGKQEFTRSDPLSIRRQRLRTCDNVSTGNYKLSEGVRHFNDIELNKEPPIITAGSLRVHIEHASGPNTIRYEAELLSQQDIAAVEADPSPKRVIDVNTLNTEITLHNCSSLYVRSKSTMIKLSWDFLTAT